MRIAIEAADYLNSRILKNPRATEPLVPALGGVHLALKKNIVEDLEQFANYQIQPLFVFSGLDLTRPEDPFRQRAEGATVNTSAWDLYERHEATSSVVKFGESSQSHPC